MDLNPHIQAIGLFLNSLNWEGWLILLNTFAVFLLLVDRFLDDRKTFGKFW